MITVVPVGRIAPIAGNMPLRTFQSAADSPGSVVKRSGVASANEASAAAIASILTASAAALAARVSTSRAAPSAGRARSVAGMPGASSTERSDARSSSSTAATGVGFREVTAPHATSRWSNRISALALWACSSTVR